MPPRMTVSRNVMELEYAVRGPIPQRAAELRRQGREVISCNIGNPQALGQKPISFYRQVLSLLEAPEGIRRERTLRSLYGEKPERLPGLGEEDFVSPYVLDLSEEILSKMGTGLGAYTESQGPLFIREGIARFIDERDGAATTGGVRSDPEGIFLTNGASEAAKYIIDMLLAESRDGIMIPIPQYPLYSAAIKKAGGVQVDYYLDEESGWALDRSILEESLRKAVADGVRVKAIVVINPGNPTGAILPEQSGKDVVDFALEHGLAIIADEVYQENLYGGKFVSFARLVGESDLSLFSLHSTSKGFCGECGHRGGYVEMRNPPELEGTRLSFKDVLMKLASVSLCSNTVGQALTYLMVSAPEEGSEPYESFLQEKRRVLQELFDKATLLRTAFEGMEGVECFGRIGALYLFPRLGPLPPGTTDFDYCMSLLEKTGLCTVNGSGFGQRKGTHHLRIAFLPPKEKIQEVVPRWVRFHREYLGKK